MFARSLLLAVALGASASAQNYKLNVPLSGARDVVRYELSANGKWVVYRANQDTEGSFTLYSVSPFGKDLTRIVSRGCFDFALSPDSRRVVFTRPDGLGSVNIDGSSPARVLGPLPNSFAFQITPDSTQVVFLRSRNLYRVPIEGGEAPTLLHDAQRDIQGKFVLTPDSRRAVYVTDCSFGTCGMGQLFVAPLDGSGPPYALNAATTPAATGDFAFSADWIVFRQPLESAQGQGLYTVPLDGSRAPVCLHPPLGPGGRAFTFTEGRRPRFSPDGERIVFLLDPDGHHPEVYSGPIDGGAPPVKLNATLPDGGQVLTFRITADGGRVVYIADQELLGTFELYVVPIAGGAVPRKLNAPLVSGGGVFTFELSPDGQHLAYVADQELDGRFEAYLAALDPGPAVIKLSDPSVSPLVYPHTTYALEFTQGGSLLVYAGYEAGIQLYAVDTSGLRLPWRLDGPDVAGGSVRSSGPLPTPSEGSYYTRIGADGKRAVYLADQDHDDVFELYASPLLTPRIQR